MRRILFSLALALAGIFAAGLLANSASMAQDEQCPANSHPVGETADTIQCKCNDPLINDHGKCQYKAAIEDRLQQRIIATLKGIKSTTEAIDAERSGLLYGEAAKHFKKIELSVGAALLAQQPALLAPEAMSLSADIGSLLGKWKACTSTPSLRAECDNLHNFQRILNESATELIAVQKK